MVLMIPMKVLLIKLEGASTILEERRYQLSTNKTFQT
jgi:hypothetical protein